MTRSFLKWAGGKHRVADALLRVTRDARPLNVDWDVRTGQRYHEPMMGSGSMYFRLRESGFISSKKKSMLADLNHILISMMTTVGDHESHEALFSRLRELQEDYPSDLPHPNPRGQEQDVREQRMFYRKRRELNRLASRLPALSVHESIELAALAIFLNKTCYNGLWRMNSHGHFNTPEGAYTRPKNIYQPDVIVACAGHLKQANLSCQDWRKSLARARPGDLVYIDAPYMPIKFGDQTFTDYFSAGFSMQDQRDLANSAALSAAKGVRIIASNHDTEGNPNVRHLYQHACAQAGIQAPAIVPIDVSRTISCKGHGRQKVSEVLIFMGK